jgi:ribonuclease P protein component
VIPVSAENSWQLHMKASSKQNKLLNSRQFRAVYNQGQRFSTRFFSAFILETDSGDQRLGITVTRKIGGAVGRNRCKRRIRELFRRQGRQTLGNIGCDIVINAKSPLITADYQQLEEAFSRTLARFRESCFKLSRGR